MRNLVKSNISRNLWKSVSSVVFWSYSTISFMGEAGWGKATRHLSMYNVTDPLIINHVNEREVV